MLDDRVLLFDLGGVLVKSSGQIALKRLLPHLDKEEIRARWLDSRSIALFERGSISPESFARMFVIEWQLEFEPFEFLSAFSTWVSGFYPGAKSLLRRLRARHTVGCLSNTNATHWARLTEVQTAFDVCIASHLTGHMKPDRVAYENAVQRLAVPASSVYFFDDLESNVAAARRVGIHAFHVRGLREVEAALRYIGISPDADP